MARAPSLVGVILAAGASSRMGRDKALLPWHGETFLSAHIRALQMHTELVIVVAGANACELTPIVDANAAFLAVNRHPEQGQFSSLQIGLQEVLNYGRDAAMIALVDRPPLASESLRLIRRAFEQAVTKDMWAVIPEYQGRHGHPIVVGREMITAFMHAPATSNASEVLRQHAQRVSYVAVNDPSVVANIDTPEDYEKITGLAAKP
jgi:molybdenum cofactor cytidylyltransferase